jgi:magnesium transporter
VHRSRFSIPTVELLLEPYSRVEFANLHIPSRMRPTAHLSVSAPSSRLLRFLRSQSEGLCFFTSNPRLCQHQQDGRTAPSLPSRIPQKRSQSRSLSTTTARRATLEASLIDFLWPRSKEYSTHSKSCLQNSSFEEHPPTSYRPFHHTRKASTSDRPFLRRLWELKRRKNEPKLEPNDLPSGGYPDDGIEASMFNLGRSLAVKASSEPRLRCTEFDENGNVTLVNGEFKKSELIAKVCY